MMAARWKQIAVPMLVAACHLGTVCGQLPAGEKPDPLSEQTAQAEALLSSGKYAEAQTAYLSLVADRAKVDGPENPKTLAARRDLALVLARTGEPVKAEEEMRTLLAIYARRLGANHQETLSSRASLAKILADQGRYTEAVREYRLVLEAREGLLGPDDLEVARTRGALAGVLDSSGLQSSEAEKNFREAQAVLDRALGPEHVEALFNRSNRAVFFSRQGRYDEAIAELLAILAIRERTLGARHPSVYMTYLNLARVLGGASRLQEALPYAKRAEKGLAETLGEGHEQTRLARALIRELENDLAAGKKEKK